MTRLRQVGHIPVIRVIARLNVGGPALHVSHLCRLAPDRFRTLLVTGRVDADEGDLTESVRARGVELRIVDRLGRRVALLDDLRVLIELVRLFRAARPLVVHTHTAKAGTVGRLAALLAGVPVRVHTFHGHVFQGYFSTAKSRLIVLVERALAQITTRIIAISPRQADELVDEYRVCSRERLRVVPLGLELDRFTPEGSRTLRDGFRAEVAADGRPVLACVGRLVPIKNHDLLLDAVAELARRGRDVLLVVAGRGSEESRLQARAASLGIMDRVRFVGWRTDLDRIYAGADVVVLTSRNEGTPVCLIEALAAGCPVVATDVGGVRDVVAGIELASLAPSGSVTAIADAIEARLDAVPSDEARAAAARAMVTRYGVERLVTEINTMYDELTAPFAPGATYNSERVA